jgi:hypothetical protein
MHEARLQRRLRVDRAERLTHAPDRRLIANLDPQRIEEHDGIQALERPALPGGHLGDDLVGDGADHIGRDLHGVPLGQEAPDFAHCHAPRVQREDRVIEAGEPALGLRDQLRLERARAIPRHRDRHRAVVGQDGLRPRPIAMIGALVGCPSAGRVAQVVRELTAQGPLDQRLLEAAYRSLKLGGGQRTVAHELVKNVRRHRGKRLLRCRPFRFAA